MVCLLFCCRSRRRVESVHILQRSLKRKDQTGFDLFMMKQQTYYVQRVTLMPNGQTVWAQMAARHGYDENVKGTIDVIFPIAEAPTAGMKFMLTIEQIVEEKK